MSQLEEQILKQNVLEEHRQVHELQVRVKELLVELEKSQTELAKLRKQVGEQT